MTQADSVHSTPPTNTSAIDDTQSPTKPPESAQQGPLYIPTDVTPEELFQAIGRLRKEARDEIDRLIGFLDKTDDYISRELEESNDDEPSLGWTNTGLQCGHCGGVDDLEAEPENDEARRPGRTVPRKRRRRAFRSAAMGGRRPSRP
jgi:hypothetical protein